MLFRSHYIKLRQVWEIDCGSVHPHVLQILRERGTNIIVVQTADGEVHVNYDGIQELIAALEEIAKRMPTEKKGSD